ncbi:MAG: hypothetical protein WCO44_01975 [Bacteroidota bacterium]
MKKLAALLVIVLLVGQVKAQPTEFLPQKDFRVEKQKIYEGINASRRQLTEIRQADVKMRQSLDSLKHVIVVYSGQLTVAADSLAKTTIRLNALQEKVNSEKVLPRGLRILFLLILLLLFVLVFILLYMIHRKAGLKFDSLSALDAKTNERLADVSKTAKTDIQVCRDLVLNTTNEMDQRIESGLNALEVKHGQLESQITEKTAGIDALLQSAGKEIAALKEVQANGLKNLEEKLNSLLQNAENQSRALTDQVAKIEGEILRMKGK